MPEEVDAGNRTPVGALSSWALVVVAVCGVWIQLAGQGGAVSANAKHDAEIKAMRDEVRELKSETAGMRTVITVIETKLRMPKR